MNVKSTKQKEQQKEEQIKKTVLIKDYFKQMHSK
jgi:hypothetical protein